MTGLMAVVRIGWLLVGEDNMAFAADQLLKEPNARFERSCSAQGADSQGASSAALAWEHANHQNLRVLGRSDVAFFDRGSGEAIDALADARIIASSSGLGWADVHVEVGRNDVWEVDDVFVSRHYLALNTDDVALTFEARVDGKFRRTTLAPGETWFCPAGESFSHRVAVPARFALVTMAPSKLVRIFEDDKIELRRTYAVGAPQLEHLVRALAAEADRGGPSGSMFVDSVTTALASQIVACFGASATPRTDTGGLSKKSLRRVLQEIDARLADGVTVERLALTAGLGPAQFARAFKQATRESPHQFVIRRRLEEAKQALELRDPDILNVALRFGFSDQAHFTRLFKRQFGVPPGRFVRERAR
jgi:AraC family transcriptional regulator